MDGRNTHEVLRFRDGHAVAFDLDRSDETALRLRHTWPRPARMAGPHWHPVLHETFEVRAGMMLFRLDGRDLDAGPGTVIDVPPNCVHEFWNRGHDLVLEHAVWPPMRHREMFELWHALDAAGRMTASGMPKNPVDLARLWALRYGFLAGVPVWLQRTVLGGLSRLTWPSRPGVGPERLRH